MNATSRQIILPVAADLHVHFRDGERLKYTVPATAAWAGYGIAMPNLAPKHVTLKQEVLDYRQRILDAVPHGVDFTPLMTISLLPDFRAEELREALGHVHAVKFYAGHTTNATGVDDVTVLDQAFEIIEESGKPLLIHGEAGKTVDVFDRESRFYEGPGQYIVQKFPAMKIVAEHISTRTAVEFVRNAADKVAATITVQHLLSNRNHMLGQGGANVHMMCLPILKREEDQQALIAAATSGNPKFFLGTDSAPHPRKSDKQASKESAMACCGCYTAEYALALYAQAFAEANALDKLPAFASENGLKFYGLTSRPGQIIIEEVEPYSVKTVFDFGDGEEVVHYMPFGQEKLSWKVTRV